MSQKEPEQSYQRDGKRWHKQTEKYLKTGALPTEEPPLALLVHLPTPPVPARCVEFNVRGRAPGATGIIDLIDVVGSEGIDGRGLHAGLVRLTDYKFRSKLSLSTFVDRVGGEVKLKPDQAVAAADLDVLKRTCQPLHYTSTFFRDYSLEHPTLFRWLVVEKQRCRVAPVHVLYEPGEAYELFGAHWRPTIERIRFTRRLTLGQVPPTGAFLADLTHSCGQYGGCFFRPWCAQAGIDVYRDKWGASPRRS